MVMVMILIIIVIINVLHRKMRAGYKLVKDMKSINQLPIIHERSEVIGS